MIAPLAAEPVLIEIAPPLVSRPYIDLTLAIMERFGFAAALHRASRRPSSPDTAAQLERPADGGSWALRTVPSGYRAADYAVPPDASSASYFFAAAAVTRGRVTVAGLSSNDPQGDIGFLDRLRAIGCLVEEDGAGVSVEGPVGGRLKAFDFDLAGTPDLVPTLAVLALFADGPSEIRNVANLRLKESDRIAGLAAELACLGARVEERADGLRIVPGPLHGARIETYGDHRMAMAFAVAGLAVPGISIVDPECVAKSFPTFWEVLTGLTGPSSG
jgi:3-phosphoshikimate 1-carboxyvinyltransferase